jgi:hypothetical protein
VKKTDQEEKHSPCSGDTEVKIERGVILGCVILILLHFIASFFPHARLWGINPLHYFPLSFRIALSVVALLILLIPKFNEVITKILEPLFEFLASKIRKFNRYVIYIAVSLIGIVPFWLFLTRTLLLGDGYCRAMEAQAGKLLNLTESGDFYFPQGNNPAGHPLVLWQRMRNHQLLEKSYCHKSQSALFWRTGKCVS